MRHDTGIFLCFSVFLKVSFAQMLRSTSARSSALKPVYFAIVTASVKCSYRIAPAMLRCTAWLFLRLPFIGFVVAVVSEDCGSSSSCAVPASSDAFASLQVSQHEATHDGQTECSWLKSGPWGLFFFVSSEEGGSEAIFLINKYCYIVFLRSPCVNKSRRG